MVDTSSQPHITPFLDELHPGSFNTLTLIDIHIATYVHPGSRLAYPYGWRWSAYLQRLPRLERLRIELLFEGEFDVNIESFGQQWGDIPKALANDNVCPVLRAVDILVDVRVRNTHQDFARHESQGRTFVQIVKGMVYLSYLQALKNQRSQWPLSRWSFGLVPSFHTATLSGLTGFNTYTHRIILHTAFCNSFDANSLDSPYLF